MNRIDERFFQLKDKKKKAFLAFITAGYPSLKITEQLIYEFEDKGVDVIELGVPFSDPLADGKTIQESSQKSLEKGTTVEKILQLVKKVRVKVTIPIVLMTYYNPLYAYGLKKLAKNAASAGVDGFIIPDLPPEEADTIQGYLSQQGLELVFLATPTSNNKRLSMIGKKTAGFLYYVSLTGVTGGRVELPKDIVKKIKLCKSYTKKPVCVGFGVSTKEQVKEMIQYADGVIVGSAIIQEIKKHVGSALLVKKVGAFVHTLARTAHETKN